MNQNLQIHFIRNYTIEPIGRAIVSALLAEGYAFEDSYGGYGNAGFELAEFTNMLNIPPYIVVSLDLEYFAGGFYSSKWSREVALQEFNALMEAIDRIPPSCFVVLTDFLLVPESGLPELPGHRLYGRNLFIREVSLILHEFAATRQTRCAVLSYESIILKLGAPLCIDKRFSMMSKSPFTQRFAEEAGREFVRIHQARARSPKKVLVLDCDNTLWGQVVGEVGTEGIELDPYEYPGICYYRFQSRVLGLIDKGFILCLNSKNDEGAVLKVLDEHPHCLIRREHVAGQRINWTDKASNMISLSKELNLGLDSFVFVDDNPAECELIRSQLPVVEVLQVPRKLYELPDLLDTVPWFDRTSISTEDKLRTGFYRAEKERKGFEQAEVDPISFLEQLEMTAKIRAPQESDTPRIVQLCQRTNQFNLTTLRHDESSIAKFLKSNEHMIFLLEAADRFGPLGICGLIILENKMTSVKVDSFLLSCRIIGRGYDQALFRYASDMATQVWGAETFQGVFRATQKNSVVERLWESYGFSEIPSDGDRLFQCQASKLKVIIPHTIKVNHEI